MNTIFCVAVIAVFLVLAVTAIVIAVKAIRYARTEDYRISNRIRQVVNYELN